MFSERYGVIQADSSKTVSEIAVRIIAEKFSGEVHLTDVMLQGGRLSTNWTGHPSEQHWSNE
jgi:hypothetical protein